MEQKNINYIVGSNCNIRILLICVNYNSYCELYNFLKSANNSVKNSLSSVCVDVYIVDNSTEVKDVIISDFSDLNISISRHGNLGYLGGAFYIINSLDCISKYDYIIISNVDLIIDDSFFSKLSLISPSCQIGWIVPSIFSESENRDRNPKVINRYSKFRLYLLYFMYKYPFLHFLYQKTLYKRKYINKQYNQMEIYAGHGSFMIFTKAFFSKNTNLNYPVFLFGEEIYFAELMRKSLLKVVYFPDLKVIDKEHVSTSKMKSSLFYKYNREAIKYLISTFYE